MLTYHLFRLFSTFENSLRTLPNNGCCSIAYSTSRLLKTVHGFSRHGCQSIACSDPQFRDVPKRGWLSDTYSGFIQMQFYTDSSSGNPTPVPSPLLNFWKQFTDASQQRMLLYCLFNFKTLKTVYGFFPTTDVNLSLVQTQLLKTVYGRFPTTDATDRKSVV